MRTESHIILQHLKDAEKQKLIDRVEVNGYWTSTANIPQSNKLAVYIKLNAHRDNTQKERLIAYFQRNNILVQDITDNTILVHL
jgi:hypothetical protein